MRAGVNTTLVDDVIPGQAVVLYVNRLDLPGPDVRRLDLTIDDVRAADVLAA